MKRIFVAFLVLLVVLVLFAPSSTDVITPMDGLDIHTDLLSPAERAEIKTTTLAVLEQFLTQSADEPAASRAARLATYLSSDSIVLEIPLYVINTYSSQYGIVEQTTASPPDHISWSKVEEDTVVVYAIFTVTFMDSSGFTDSNLEYWFAYFTKEDGQWRVYNLEKWRATAISESSPT